MSYAAGRGWQAVGQGLTNFGGSLLQQLREQKDRQMMEDRFNRSMKMQEADAGLRGIFMGDAPVDHLPGSGPARPVAPDLVGEGIVNQPRQQETVSPTVQSAPRLEEAGLLKRRYTQGDGFFIDHHNTDEAKQRRARGEQFEQGKEMLGLGHQNNVELEGVRGENARELEGIRGQTSRDTARISADASLGSARIGADASVRAAGLRLNGPVEQETQEIAAGNRAARMIQQHGSARAAIAALPKDHPGSALVQREIERLESERLRRQYMGIGTDDDPYGIKAKMRDAGIPVR